MNIPTLVTVCIVSPILIALCISGVVKSLDCDMEGRYQENLVMARSLGVPECYQKMIAIECADNAVPVPFVAAIIREENPRWNAFQRVVESNGTTSKGLMNLNDALIPDLERWFASGPIERFDPEQSVRYGVRYIRRLYNRFHDWRMVAAAYNCGPSRAARGEAQWPGTTKAYVAAVVGDK